MNMNRKLLILLVGMCFSNLYGCSHSQGIVELNDDVLFYKTLGDGETNIVFLHGLLGSHRYWDGVVSKLSSHHRLVLIDLYGFGNSQKPKTDYSVDQHVDKIEKTLSGAVGKKSAVIVGHSMGAFLALNYAIAYPERVQKLVLINAPMITTEEALKNAIAESSSQIMVTMTFSKTWGKLACRMHELLPRFSYPIIRLFEPNLPAPVARAAGQHTWESYSGSFKNVLLDQNFYELLAKVPNIPILILASNRDEYTKDEALKKLPQRKNLKLITIDGNHNVLLHDPERISSEISRFLP